MGGSPLADGDRLHPGADLLRPNDRSGEGDDVSNNISHNLTMDSDDRNLIEILDGPSLENPLGPALELLAQNKVNVCSIDIG